MLNSKKTIIKWGAACMAGVLAVSVMGASVCAKTPEDAGETQTDVKEQLKETVDKIWQPEDVSGKLLKDETVYVLAGADGTAEKIIVSDRLQNGTGAEQIEDETLLSDVTIVKNGEEYTKKSDDTYVWEAKGDDVYYQGTIEKELPVSVKVTYYLDGEEVKPENIAGKTGHMVIRYEFINNEHESKIIAGEEKEIQVPYVTLTGIVLDNTKFSNITVSSGKVINDGTRSIVAGIAFPGMNDNLGLSEVTLPEYVEIEADAGNITLDSAYTVVSNEIFNGINLTDVDSVSELQDAMTQLTDAMSALMDGSSDLYDGLSELSEKSGELADGAGALADGAEELKNGGVSLSSGASQLQTGAQSLESGAASLASGLSTLDSKSGELTGGAKQVFNSLLATANAKLAENGIDATLTIENYADTLNNIMAAGQQEIYNQVCAGVRAAVLTQVLASQGMTTEQYEALSEESRTVIDTAVDTQMETDEVKQQISALLAEQSSNPAISQLAGLKSQLDSYNTFYQGLLAYTAGVASASSGAAQINSGAAKLSAGAGTLASGAQSLSDGAGTLKSGLDTLSEGSDALVAGVSKLCDGALQLRDGLTAFDEEGIEKLTELAGVDLEGFTERLQAIVDVSKEYNSFAGKSDDMEGTVKFIIKTAEVEAK